MDHAASMNSGSFRRQGISMGVCDQRVTNCLIARHRPTTYLELGQCAWLAEAVNMPLTTVCECVSVCMYVSIVPMETRSHQIPLELELQTAVSLLIRVPEIKLQSSEEQYTLLTTEPHL